MAKKSLNIIDFSGGLNTLSNKRDIGDNQLADLDSFISYTTGDIKLAGGFLLPNSLKDSEGGFQHESSPFGLKSLDYFNPSSGFKMYNKATVSVSSDTGTFTVGSGSHGLTTGYTISIVSGPSTWLGKSFIITKTNYNTFTATGCTGLADDTLFYCIEGVYNTNEFTNVEAFNNPDDLNYFVKNCNGKFGFYNLKSGTFFGALDDEVNSLGGNSWLFDIRYLWDWQQDNTSNNPSTDYSDLTAMDTTPVYDSFYIDGVYRASMEPPQYNNFGHLRRPVGLYYISRQERFFEQELDINAITVESGWYPLRTHCLPLREYRSSTAYDNDGFHWRNTALTTHTGFSQGLLSYGTPTTVPTTPYDIQIGLSHNNSGGSGTALGDWFFADDGDHSELGIGISLLYDEIVDHQSSAQQESPITTIYSSGTANRISMTSGTNQDNAQLTVSYVIHPGISNGTSATNSYLGSGWQQRLIPELRGSGVNNGYGQMSHWNPRIVGFNIYITYTHLQGELAMPLWLGTCSFIKHKTHQSRSHDGNLATAWESVAEGYRQTFLTTTVPVVDYEFKNGYKHDVNTSAWWKTSAIANRKLYAGNVSYFEKVSGSEESERITRKPDRILVSPENNFDILPVTSYLDVSKDDGQNIVKLESLNKHLLIFKDNEMYLVDTTTAPESIVGNFPGYGVSYPNHVYKSKDYIFWINKHGIYSFNGEEVVNLIKDRLDQDKWKRNMFDISAHPVYDPQQDLLIVFCKNTDIIEHSNHANQVIILSASTGAMFYKSRPSSIHGDYFSNGVYANNLLYLTSTIDNSGGESFIASNTTVHAAPIRASAEFLFQLTATGTHGDGSSCNINNLNADVDFLMVRKSGTWTKMNNDVILSRNLSNPSDAATETVNLINTKCNNVPSGRNQDTTQNEYNIEASAYPGGSSYIFMVRCSARAYGSAYTISATDLSGSGYSMVGASSTTGISFSSDGTSGNIGIGNISTPIFQNNISGTDQTQSVYRLSVDRAGNRDTGSMYRLWLSGSSADLIPASYVINYVTGNTSEYNGTYLDEVDSTASSDVRNDRLLSNIKEYLENHKMLLMPHGGLSNYKLDDFFTFASIAGTSGSKYFDITAKAGMPDNYHLNETISLSATCTNSEGGIGIGALLVWSNVVPLDNSGNPTILSHNRVVLETKDIDFGEPNIRKKVYKAYITYKGGDGSIKIEYKANQSASWTTAAVTGETTAGYLTDSSVQTRAEVTFGTGGNNVYSFALRLTNQSAIYDLEINDISFVYRLKKPK